MTETLRAWKVEWNDYEDRCVVVFAGSRNEARKMARYEDAASDADWLDIVAHRAPEFDGCQDPESLTRAQLDHGWWFWCSECQHRVTSEGCWQCAEAEHDSGAVDPPAHIVDIDRVFCSRECWAAWWSQRGRFAGNHKAVQLEALDLWPGIVIGEANGTQLPIDPGYRGPAVGGCRFLFPGGKYPVSWVRGDAHVSVSECDEQAWRKFAAAAGGSDGS